MFYRYILKYTSLLGSVQVLNVLLNVLRNMKLEWPEVDFNLEKQLKKVEKAAVKAEEKAAKEDEKSGKDD